MQEEVRGDGSQLGELGRQVGEDARDFAASLGALVQEAQEVVQQSLAARPYVTLAAAAGVGYVLGGGLGSRLTGMAMGIGGKMLLRAAISQVLMPSEQDEAEH